METTTPHANPLVLIARAMRPTLRKHAVSPLYAALPRMVLGFFAGVVALVMAAGAWACWAGLGGTPWVLAGGLLALAVVTESLEVQRPSGEYVTFLEVGFVLAFLALPTHASVAVAALVTAWSVVRFPSSWWSSLQVGSCTALTAALALGAVAAAKEAGSTFGLAAPAVSGLAITGSFIGASLVPMILLAWIRVFAGQAIRTRMAGSFSVGGQVRSCAALLIEHGPTTLLAAIALSVTGWALPLAALPFLGAWYTSEQRLALHAARELANRDALTGLLNRSGLLDAVTTTLATGGCDSLAVLLGDLDDFKRINDVLGHADGDRALQAAAKVAAGIPGCIAARYGGEEFVIVLAGADAEAARAVAETWRSGVEDALREVESSMSIGIALLTSGDGLGGFDAALERADRAMYAAKYSGKNRVHELLSSTPEAAPQPSWSSTSRLDGELDELAS